jgi:LysM repeat protein
MDNRFSGSIPGYCRHNTQITTKGVNQMGFKMKYEIKKQYLTSGSLRRSGIKMPQVGFLVAHDTGNPGSTAEGNVGYYERSRNDMSASAHIFVDHDSIVECVPFLTGTPEKAWHVLYNVTTDNAMYGDDANDIAGGVEMCFGPGIDSGESYKRYVWVLAYACYKFNLNPAKHIVGHKILDPGRKIDPHNGLKYMGKTYEQLLLDVIAEYNDCTAPEVVAKPAPTVSGATYTIQAGDTFWGIAQRSNGAFTVQDLIAWNPDVNAAALTIGMVINIQAPVVQEVAIYHTIEKGDTFWDLAAEKKVSVEDIKKWNPKVNPDKLSIGEKIIVGYQKKVTAAKQPVAKKPAAKKPAPAPAPKKKVTLPNKVLKRGAKGAEVLAVQEALCKVYFYPEKGAKNNGCDGSYGLKTENAVKRFQSVYLALHDVDGVYGSKTKAKLEELLNK